MKSSKTRFGEKKDKIRWKILWDPIFPVMPVRGRKDE